MAYRGHSVLQVPVPGMEDWVRARTAHYDPSFLSTDSTYVHAHVTALGPFVENLDEDTARRVADVAASVEPFTYTLDRLATFPNGIIHLLPEPADGFEQLTKLLIEAFPEHPPYRGAFPPLPHLTLDLAHDDVSETSTRTLLGDLVPMSCRAERLDLAWYEADNCHRVTTWPLGAASA